MGRKGAVRTGRRTSCRRRRGRPAAWRVRAVGGKADLEFSTTRGLPRALFPMRAKSVRHIWRGDKQRRFVPSEHGWEFRVLASSTPRSVDETRAPPPGVDAGANRGEGRTKRAALSEAGRGLSECDTADAGAAVRCIRDRGRGTVWKVSIQDARLCAGVSWRSCSSQDRLLRDHA